MTALATTDELAARLPFVMDTDEEREATGALEDLSDDARHYGRSTWDDPATVPAEVKNLVLRAAARHMKNPDGFTSSRAGDENVYWTDRGQDSGSATFTEAEIKKLKALSGRSTGFHSSTISAWGSPDRDTAGTSQLVRDENGFLMPMPSVDPW